jgi:putative addiction module killer protein
MTYTYVISEMVETPEFTRWFENLKDDTAYALVERRLERLSQGHPGNVASVGEGISEMKIDYGPGYRVYFKQDGNVIIILLAGGTKGTQSDDIKAAKKLLRDF